MAEATVSNLIVQITSDQRKFAEGADESTNALRKQKQAAKEASKDIKGLKDSLKGATSAAKSHASALKKVVDAVKRIAFYRVIRSAIREVTQAMREGINNLYQYSTALNSLDSASAKNTMDEFATTALYVKNSIGAALMPILQALVPIVNAVADAFVYAANAVNQFFHMLKGDATFTKAKRYATEYADALGGAGKAAKELKKQVFGFDELNIFNSPSSGGGGGGGGLDYSKMFEEAEVSTKWGALKELIKNNLAGIELIVGAASLAVGAILALSGVNIPVGIGLMALGAASMTAGMLNWKSLDPKVESAVKKIAATVGGALLALGAILALSGADIPLGIGLVAAGALSLAAAAGIQWDFLGNTIDEKMGFITGIVSTAFLFLGAVMALSGANIPLGLGLLVLGGAGLAASLHMNNNLKKLIQEYIGVIEVAIGGAFLFLGAVAALTGNIPLGLGLLVLGAAMLNKGSKDLNDDLKNRIGDKLDKIKGIVTKATIALGGILIFVNPALGIPLLIGGLALQAEDIDWDALNKRVKEAWEKVKQTGRNIKKDLLGWWEDIKAFFKGIIDFNASVTLTPSMEAKNNVVKPAGAKTFAEGGMPETGSLFWAGENGAELVGQVGGRTTVTNQEQFTAGMEGIMDNTNSVIIQCVQRVIEQMQRMDTHPIVTISDRDIMNANRRATALAGASMVE